jgi:Ca-activated chloride channel family protein
MKRIFISHALFAGVFTLAATAFADNGLLELRVTPEREQVLKSDNAEVIFDVNLQGRDSTSERHTPINLALVLDHSGSMEGAKIEKAREAACIAIDQLEPSDVFSLVQFDDQVDVLIPAQPVEDKERLKRIVNRIVPGGSTALYAGVQEGAHQLRKYFDEKDVNRVVLVSDGIANVGPSSPSELAELGRDLREKGSSVTTVGLGEDYNEDVMASIAEASGANYYYVKDAEKLPDIFEKELGKVKNAVAQDIRIIIELPDGVEPIEIVGMPDAHFEGNKATVRLGSFYASQRRDLLVRCRVKSPEGDSAEIGRVHVVYAAPGDGKDCQSDAAATVKFTDRQADSDKSVNASVATQLALGENTATRQRALELQDAVKYKDAAKILRAQAGADAKLAPVLKNDKLAAESADLDSVAGQLDKDTPMGNGQRKTFQYENYNQANQREDQQ